MSVQSVVYDRINYVPTVKRIPDKLWDEIRLILPSEKPANAIGRQHYHLGSTGWYFVCLKNWMSMEDVAKGIWFGFDMP